MAWTEVALGKQQSRTEPGRPFVVESQLRVLEHCRQLLSQENLTEDLRQRLLRLAAITEEEIQWLSNSRTLEAA